MACGGCKKRRAARATMTKDNKYDVMGGFKYLPERQLRARLEVFKKTYCGDCDTRYKCNYDMNLKCNKK